MDHRLPEHMYLFLFTDFYDTRTKRKYTFFDRTDWDECTHFMENHIFILIFTFQTMFVYFWIISIIPELMVEIKIVIIK